MARDKFSQGFASDDPPLLQDGPDPPFTAAEAVTELGPGEDDRGQAVTEDPAHLRRHLQKDRRLFDRRARDVMTPQPKTIGADELATKALELMEHHAITSLLIVEEGGRPAGIIHLHDLLRAKIA